MSLALCALAQRHAVIVSDGAATGVLPDGTMVRDRNDVPKFRKVGSGMVVAAVGPLALVEQIWDNVTEYVAQSPGVTFDDVARLLSTHLPACHDRFAADAISRASVDADEHDVAVTLAGYDHRHARARLMVFGPGTGYAPIDAECTVMGMSPDSHGLLAAAVAKSPSVVMLARAMRSILVKLARESAEIGGTVYACEIGPHGVTMQRPGAELPATLVAVGVRLGVTPHLRGSFQTYTATKTVNYGPGSFVEQDDVLGGAPAHGFVINGSLNPNGNSTADPEQDFYCIVALPDRATITNVYADVYSENNGSGGGSAQGHNTTVRYDRVSTVGGVTNLGNVAAGDNGGWQTLNMAMSDSTTGRHYNFHFITSQGSAPSTPSHTRLADFFVVYSIPDPATGI